MVATSFTSVSAVAVPYAYQSGSQSLTRAADGNIYTVIPGDNVVQTPPLYLSHSEDINFETYMYSDTSWNRAIGSLTGPANRSTNFPLWSTDSDGWLDPGVSYPTFWKLLNQTNDLSASVNWRIREFPLAVGQNATTILESNSISMGLLNITTEAEMYHITVQNPQDDTELYVMGVDPQGRLDVDMYVGPGDISLYPLQFTGTGLYKIIIYADSAAAAFVPVTISIESVEPIVLPAGQLTQGVLSGSEWIVNQESGDVYYKEQVPTAYTFKVTSPEGRPGRLRYSLNFPEFSSGTYETRDPVIFITANISQASFGAPSIFLSGLGMFGHEWWYQSYENQSYYVTITGMDNVEFSFLNDVPEAKELPVNTNLFLDAGYAIDSVYGYTLHLSEDSLLSINSTEYNGGYSWQLGTYHNGNYFFSYLSDSHNFPDASVYYLPAGDYVVNAFPGSISAYGFYTFTVGPVLDGTGVYSVADSSILGVRVSADILNDYAANVTLTTNDNVSVTTDIQLFSEVGRSIGKTTSTMGHYQTGFGWSALGNNFTMYECGLLTSRRVDDGSLIISVKPYSTRNTTGGVLSNNLPGKMHTFDIDFVDYTSEAFNGTAALDATSGTGSHSIVLEEPQDATEKYVLDLSLKPNTWYNVSVQTQDVTDLSMNLFQDYNGRANVITWGYLSQTKVGTLEDFGVQFGSIGSDAALVISIDRDPLVDGGWINVTVTEFLTNEISVPLIALNLPFPVVTVGGALPSDWLAQNGLVVTGGIVAGVAVVVLILVVLKKRRP